jgi:hypothetical protein
VRRDPCISGNVTSEKTLSEVKHLAHPLAMYHEENLRRSKHQ